MAGAALGGMAGGLTSGFIEGFTKRKEYQKQKDFITMRHRWEVRDLKKAGLNPILSAGGSPGIGSMPDISGPGREVGRGISEGVSKYLEAKRLKAEIELMQKQGRKADQERDTSANQANYLQSLGWGQNLQNDQQNMMNSLLNKYGDLERLAGLRQTASMTKKNLYDSSGFQLGGLRFNASADLKETVNKFLSEMMSSAKEYHD